MRELAGRMEIKTGFWSLFDQGTVSLGNFVTQMLLARYLSWGEYGVFALIYGVLFFSINSLGILVTYPLSVKGGSVDPDQLRRLAGTSLIFSILLAVPNGLIVLGAVAALHRVELFAVSWLALSAWQIQETLRRALMARLGHGEASWGDTVSYIGQASAIALLLGLAKLTLSSALLAIAGTSAVAALIQVIQVKPLIGGLADHRFHAREFWRLGGWASATNLMGGLTQQMFPWLLGLFFGTAAAASFQAVANPLKTINPLMVGVQNVIVPATAKTRKEQGIGVASQGGLIYTAWGTVLFLPYLIILLAWPHAVLALLYGFRSPYSHLETALRVCAPAYALGFWGDAGCALLNGVGLPRIAFVSQIGASITAMIPGLSLILRYGVVGAFASLGICAMVKTGISLYGLWATARRSISSAVDGVTP